MTKEREPEYLGDGVYASFDGWHVWLTTGAHEGPQVTNRIALEPSVYAALMRYHAKLVALFTPPAEPAPSAAPSMGVHPPTFAKPPALADLPDPDDDEADHPDEERADRQYEQAKDDDATGDS